MSARPKVTLLAGGIGGAKMAEGLALLGDEISLSIIGNVADDQEFHGLWVSPDIDTLTYTLAGLVDRTRGWGLEAETYSSRAMLDTLGEETWMILGDRDMGLHIHRSRRRAAGERPSIIARDVARRLGVVPQIILSTDDLVQTRIRTADGWRDFQTWFVREKCGPDPLDVDFAGIAEARAAREALEAIAQADLIVIAPSNPIVSIGPILAVPGIHGAVAEAPALKIAVSPLIAGKTAKGPADRMMALAGLPADVTGVAAVYEGLIDRLVIDNADAAQAPALEAMGLAVDIEATLMKSAEDKRRLAAAIIERALSPARRACA